MSVPAAYIGVIVIWGTTPLAIKWSGDAGFLFGLSARMLLGTLLCLAIMGALSIPLPRDRRARLAYLAAGAGIFVAMTAVYWAAQFIPSGLISVVFGLTPIVTGLMASLWLNERAFTVGKVAGMSLGLAGLAVIFDVDTSHLAADALFGLSGVVFSVVVHSISAVWVKRIDAQLHPLAQTGGGLLVAAPLFLLAWLLFGEGLNVQVPMHAGLSIVYLAIVGSVVGFMLYYYVIRYMDATRVALITLVTPVLALLLGAQFNHERVGLQVWAGTAIILTGLMFYQWGDRLFCRNAAWNVQARCSAPDEPP